MNKEERILCALSHAEPDRIPLYDLVSNRGFIEYWSGQALTLENANRLIPQALDRSLDMTRVFLPEALGRRVDAQGFTYERIDWFNEWQVGLPFNNMPGLISFIAKEIDRLEAWLPPDPAAALADLLRWKVRFGETVIPASWAGEPLQDAYIRIGLDWFSWLYADQPALLRRWIDAIHTALMRRLQSESGCRVVSPVAWIFGDIAYKNRLLFSPAFLGELGFFQRLAEICSLYHGYQLKVIFHSDGFISSIIPDLIRAGVDAIAPIDTAAGMDLVTLKQAFGRRLCFVGGVDVETILRTGSPTSVREKTIQLIQQAGLDGGLILGASSEELFDTLPLENILAMHETVREYGQYPLAKTIW
jgi:uroporphyrinogen decarboxylase